MELNYRERSILERSIEARLEFFHKWYLKKLCEGSDYYYKESFNDLYELSQKLAKENIINNLNGNVDEMYKQINS